MNPALREKIAEFLESEGVFEKSAASIGDIARGAGSKLKNLFMAHRGKAGLIGGAGAVGGIASLGNDEQQAQSEAAELNQLIEAYPELLYDTPAVPYGGQEQPDPQQYYQMQANPYGGQQY